MDSKIFKSFIKIIFGIYALATIYPLFWMLMNSFKETTDIVTGNSFGFPAYFNLQNYSNALFQHNILRYFLNSVAVTSSSIVLTVILSTMLAYSLARMNWKYRGNTLSYVMLGILLPSQIVLVPVFVMIRTMHLVNNPLALILTVSAFNIAMSTIIAYGFLRGIPGEMEEAAVIDGCGIFRIFFRIILPIIKPAIATMVINIFLNSWNEFMFALILISKDAYKTLPVGLMTYIGRYGNDLAGMFAAMVISSVIPIAVFLIFNNQVENALTAGAVLK